MGWLIVFKNVSMTGSTLLMATLTGCAFVGIRLAGMVPAVQQIACTTLFPWQSGSKPRSMTSLERTMIIAAAQSSGYRGRRKKLTSGDRRKGRDKQWRKINLKRLIRSLTGILLAKFAGQCLRFQKQACVGLAHLARLTLLVEIGEPGEASDARG